jgi:hypothetical protein
MVLSRKDENMKSRRFLLSLAFLSMSLVAVAQTHSQEPVQPKTDAEKSFDLMKTLAGSWEGPVTLEPPMPKMDNGKPISVLFRVTSRGNALVHEMQESGAPLDPSKYDHPVTMLYVENDRLVLTHYCDAGNRPRMEGKISPDGKKVEFEFVDLSGSNKHGHMYHAVFTIVDANHHIEDWTYLMPGDKPMHAHAVLERKKQEQASAQ